MTPIYIIFLTFRSMSGRTFDELMLVPNVPRYEFYLHSYVFRIIKCWNSIPYYIRSEELSTSGYNAPFKNKLKAFIKEIFYNNFQNDNSCTWHITCLCSGCRHN